MPGRDFSGTRTTEDLAEEVTRQRVLGQLVARLNVTTSVASPSTWDIFVHFRYAAGRTDHQSSLRSSKARLLDVRRRLYRLKSLCMTHP